MKPNRLLFFATASVLCLLHATGARGQYPFTVNPHAEPNERARRVELYVLGQYWHSETARARNVTLPLGPGANAATATGDVKAEFDDAAMWGVGVGYDFNNHFAVNGEFAFGYPDYSVSFNGSRVTGEAFLHTGKFNLDYNILSGPFTPFISAGVGYLYLDSRVPSGPTTFTCWWDYWWGSNCVGDTPTHTKAYFAANGAAGVRWDFSERMFVKAAVISNWIAVDNAADWLSTLQGTIVLGWKF